MKQNDFNNSEFSYWLNLSFTVQLVVLLGLSFTGLISSASIRIVFTLYITGSLCIGQLSLQANTLINHENHFNLTSSDIMMRFSSSIIANQITIETGSIHQEGEATLDVSTRGNSNTRGVGSVGSDGGGIGAGHGGYGGGAYTKNFNSGQLNSQPNVFFYLV